MSEKAWNQEAQYEFLLHILAQFETGRNVNWQAINIPGRTVKALQNQWTKVRKDIAAIKKNEDGGASGYDTTPAKKKPGRKPAAKKATVSHTPSDSGEENPSASVKSVGLKRGASGEVGSRKKAKTEESDTGVKTKNAGNLDLTDKET